MTHYEVLGVDPGAGVDEIRAAYRARARELHPDRRGLDNQLGTAAPGAGPEMAAVNQAWAVLGDPARRAAYDAWLKGARSPGDAEARAPGPGPTKRAPRPPVFDEDHPPPVHSAMPGCIGSGALPWLALVAILIVIFVFTAYASSGDGEDDSNGRDFRPTEPTSTTDESMVAVRDIRGMCIRVAGGITSPVDCLTVPNEGRIVAQASIGGSCPEGTVEWVVRQLDTLACTEATAPGRP